MRRPWAWMLTSLFALLAGWLLTRPAVVAQDGPALPVGVVDMQRVLQEFTEFKTEARKHEEYVQRRLNELKDYDSMRLLSMEEQDEYVDLLRKQADASPEERDAIKQRMAELEEKNHAADRKLEELSQKMDPTEEDLETLKALRTAGAETRARLQTMQQEYQRQIEERNLEISDRLDEKIRGGISFVAGQKGLTIILNENMVLFGGVDITNDVINRLNGE